MKALLPTVLAVGALVGWFAPGAPETNDGAALPRVADAPLTATSPVGRPTWHGGPLVLPRAGDGHFYADVRVDTRDYRMLVDTGASVVALTGEDARDMGLDWDLNALTPVAQGASGPVLGVPVVIGSMAVGDFQSGGVQAVIVPEGLPVSLLGQSFLAHVPQVRISGDDLTLAN